MTWRRSPPPSATSWRPTAVPGYSPERDFGGVRILRRNAGAPPVWQWQDYTPTLVIESQTWIMGRMDTNAPTPPANSGIRFARP